MLKNKTYVATIEGIRPLLMHNGQLSDPLSPYTKALKKFTAKQKKSDEDHEEIGRLEFQGGLYHDEKIGPFVPVDNLQRLLERGASHSKLEKRFKAIVGVVIPDDANDIEGYPLEYKGPRSREALWANENFRLRKNAGVQGKRVMRTRPRFPLGWSVTFKIEVLGGGVDEEAIEQALRNAGIYEGLGDWKPRYGRFDLKSLELLK
jgi:hypothetical protein